MRVRRLIMSGAVACLLLSGGIAAGGPAAAAANARFEAETRAAQWGTTVVADANASAGFVVGEISGGDWLRYDDVAVAGSRFTLLCFTSAAPANTEVGTVDVRFGSRHATPAQSIALRTVGASPNRQLAIGAGSVPDGVQRVYLTFRQASQSSDFGLDYVTFTAFPPPPSLSC
jgi:hypothetical protein